MPPWTPLLPPTRRLLTASFSRLPSSPSLLSPLLRWRTIDLRNEVGLLSRIYTGFSLCVSDRFPLVRHSLSLRIFMLVRTRQRTQEQGEDALQTAPPAPPPASSSSLVGRGFLGLMLVGFVVFFFLLLFAIVIAANPITAVLSDAGQGWVIFRWSPLASAWSHLWTRAFAATFPTVVTRGVTCLAAPFSRARVAAGARQTLIGSDSPRRQLPAQSLPGRHFFCGQSSAVGVTDTEAIN